MLSLSSYSCLLEGSFPKSGTCPSVCCPSLLILAFLKVLFPRAAQVLASVVPLRVVVLFDDCLSPTPRALSESPSCDVPLISIDGSFYPHALAAVSTGQVRQLRSPPPRVRVSGC
eukprot:Hpha_TRINITY_DN15870_c3_g3::TRINITY_DN15870_c3_g3_i8::g.187477::m.187477